jgi:predicted phosphoribosyltransferase
LLAAKLDVYAGRGDVVVLGLPRGGVPVAYEVGARLQAPLDVFVVRKLGVPGHDEVAMGALASGGAFVLDLALIDALHVSKSELQAVLVAQEGELKRREQAYGSRAQRPELRGKPVILVDDGLATGWTMRAAIAALRKLGPARVIAAVPVAAPSICARLALEADEVYCVAQPEDFLAVGLFYQDFEQTTDDEVRALLAARERPRPDGVAVDFAERGDVTRR